VSYLKTTYITGGGITWLDKDGKVVSARDAKDMDFPLADKGQIAMPVPSASNKESPKKAIEDYYELMKKGSDWREEVMECADRGYNFGM